MAVTKTQTFAEKIAELFERAKTEGMNYNTQMGHGLLVFVQI